ncbi:MAG: hypothetical protein NPIRA05_06410 [Nitrospirales bacterium]|nr:MAG: hypothetical protein NPIRA05_06410 [Nitrospirales bacterium]
MTTLSNQKVAIIGMGCRFPGESDSPEQFWHLMKDQRNAVGHIPALRWDMNRFYSRQSAASAKSYVNQGHFINWDYKEFDAGFFNFAPIEVEYFDPQQRLLLEVSWEAMENAGLDVSTLTGTDVGVYIGGFTLDHMLNQFGSGGRSTIGAHSAAGATLTILSNRLSYAYDLRGPSISVDTACSSSLVVLSYAVSDMRAGRCHMALVGGVNMMLRPEYPIAMSKGQFLARDGRSKSFDHRADGYGRGEGAGIVVLKFLEDALRDGDRVFAVIDAAGVNQDGRTNGITVPNPESQETLMRKMVAEAGIHPSSVQYVEAHGTGTPVGDPIEAKAIASVYGRSRQDLCRIGSVKSNIGHLEAAAGVAGLIKACLVLNENQVPPLATLEQPNPDIPFGENGLALADSLSTLTTNGETRRVAINAFGYGGTNAHAILSLDHYRVPQRSEPSFKSSKSFQLLPLSARDENALRGLALTYANLLRNNDETLEDTVYSMACRRTHLSHRLAIWGDTREDLEEGLNTFAKEGIVQNGTQGSQPFKGQRQPVFVYTGMGPQWWGMGQELYRYHAVFKHAVDEADEIFREISGFSILNEMSKDEATSRITETHIAQPANFVLQYALTQALRAEGVVPAAVVGHSVGEISSAWASGMLSLHDALLVACHRSRIQAKAAGSGGMLAVGLRYDDVYAYVAESQGTVSIAAVNSPTSITLAGDQSYLNNIQVELEKREIFARPLRVEVPYHSPMMEPLKPELREALSSLKPNIPRVPLYSTVTGGLAHDTPFNAEYWCRNVREPVFFAKAIGALLNDDYTVFIEVGPHPVLRNSLKEVLAEHNVDGRIVESFNRKKSEQTSFRRCIADVYAQGGDLQWEARHPTGQFVSLPNYPWQRQQLWRESERQRRDRLHDIARPILGIQEQGMNVWRMDLADYRLDYLADHVVDGIAIMPAAGYLEAMLQSASVVNTDAKGSYRLTDISIEKALVLGIDKPLYLETRMDSDGRRVAVHSFNDGDPTQNTCHASCQVYPLIGNQEEYLDINDISTEETREATEVYEGFEKFSLQYGPLFQPIRHVHFRANRQEVIAYLQLPTSLEKTNKDYIAHPCLLDGCFQTVLSLLDSKDGAFLPTGIRDLRIFQPLSDRFWCRGVLKHRGPRVVECDVTLISESGLVIARIDGLMCTALQPKRQDREYPTGDHMYRWTHAALPHHDRPSRTWLVLTDDEVGAQTTLCAMVEQEGQDRVVLRNWNAEMCSTLVTQTACDAIVFMARSGFDDSYDVTGELAAAALLRTLQALATRHDTPRIYVVTRGAFRIDDQDAPTIPAQGTLIGLTRVALNELGQFRPTTIDLPRFIDHATTAMLVHELRADDEKDEVAFRQHARFYSELGASNIFVRSAERELKSADGDRFSLKNDSRSGTIKASCALMSRLKSGEIELKIEASSLSSVAAMEQLEGVDDQGRLMTVCGRISRMDSECQDFMIDDRVCGFVPAALASHISVPLREALLVHVEEAIPAETAVCRALQSLARRMLDRVEVRAGERALVCVNVLGRAVAEQLQSRGVEVEPFPAQSSQWTMTALQQAQTAGAFSILVAPLTEWEPIFGYEGLSVGGCLIDVGFEKKGHFEPLSCGSRVGQLIRMDPRVEMQRYRQQMHDALQEALWSTPGHLPMIDSIDVADMESCDARIMAQRDQVTVSYGSETMIKAEAVDSPNIKEDAAYIITGAFGGLGKETAKWLAAHGAGHLMLVGRSAGQSQVDQVFMQELERMGCQVSVCACDIADAVQVEKLMVKLSACEHPLRGIFHAAGIIDDKPIVDMSDQDLLSVMRPKALGAWNLHCATVECKLDHFVLFSSISVLVGNSNQANYAAANGFLDSLASFRRAHGLAGLSVNWGAIETVGMLSRDAMIGQHLRQIGLSPISFDAGLIGLERAISEGVTQIGIADFSDWSRWARYETYGGRSPRFRTLVEAARAKDDDSAQTGLRGKLAILEPPQRQEILGGLLKEIFATKLKMSSAQVDPKCPIESLGVDSLMATEIQGTISDTLGISVSVLDLVGGGSIAKLALKSLEQMQFEVACDAA